MIRYLYVINYAEGEADLCQLEMKVLFNQFLTEKWLISTVIIEPWRSVFIKERMTILFEGLTYEDLFTQVMDKSLTYETFKLLFLRFSHQTLSYRKRLSYLSEIGSLIGGEAAMSNPKQLLGLTELDGRWLFGPLKPNDNTWVNHKNKPYSYSFSLGVRFSRAIANVAVRHDFNKKIIDPCCGVGTAVLEVLTIGGNISANELNPKISRKASENFKHYGYNLTVKTGDIREIEGHYDVAIIDLPYGHFNPIDPEIQYMIIHEARRIADQLILVTQFDMTAEIESVGFKVLDQCQVIKGKFIRYVNICE